CLISSSSSSDLTLGAVKVRKTKSLFFSSLKYCINTLIFSAFFRDFFQAQIGQKRLSQLFERCNLVFSIVLSATINKNVLHSLMRSNDLSLTYLLIRFCSSLFLNFFCVYFSMN